MWLCIFNILLEFLKKYELLDKACAISTDGASVMISEENDVVGLLKKYTRNENLLINHCLSHRLTLGAKDVWKDDPSLLNFNSTIHCLDRYFSSSSKKLRSCKMNK